MKDKYDVKGVPEFTLGKCMGCPHLTYDYENDGVVYWCQITRKTIYQTKNCIKN